MPVALELLTDAAATAGVIDPEESLSAAQAQFILRRLNRMIGSWANERLMVRQPATYTMPLTVGAGVYGTEQLSTTPPYSVPYGGNAVLWDNAFVRDTNTVTDYMLEILDQQSSYRISNKTVPGIPRYISFVRAWPRGYFGFYPIPNVDGLVAYIAGIWPLTEVLELTTAVDLSPGYEAALVDNLAVDISPSYGMTPNQQLVETARNEKLVLKRANHMALTMQLPFAARSFDIQTG